MEFLELMYDAKENLPLENQMIQDAILKIQKLGDCGVLGLGV